MSFDKVFVGKNMTVAVIFGGKSCEHNISVITGVQTMKEIGSHYEVIPVYIDNYGSFWTGELKELKAFKEGAKVKKKKVCFMPNDNRLFFASNAKPYKKIDVAILCNHGLNGEDGSLQGYLQLSNIPFTGSGVLASACGMDKITMKRLFIQNGLPVLPFIALSYTDYKENLVGSVEKIKTELTFPLIVKPANLGSSIGIGVAQNFEQLFKSIEAAFMWDNKIVIENALVDFTELNCAVLGSDPAYIVSEIEQPVGWKEFLTFDDKYTRKSEGNGRLFPAPVEPELKDKIQSFAKKAFVALDCAGVARIDFLYKDDALYVNEINTIPGALSNYLFPFSFVELIDKLIDTAFKESTKKARLKYIFKPSFKLGGSKNR